MAITPDDKNWTWVLERPCEDCGFRADELDRAQIGTIVRENAESWRPLLADARVRRRPTDDRWSALEYGCHVRDVFRLFDWRLEQMLTTDGPQYANWDQDVTAIAERYDEQDPAVVLDELLAAGAALADRFDSVAADQWTRTGFRSDGAAFTVESFGRYMVHDPSHHVHDVRAGYASIDG